MGRDEAEIENKSPLRVLIVDDNRDAANLMGKLLAVLGNNTKVVYDGFAALDTAHSFKPEAVLLDIGLPDMDGYEVARSLREIPGCENVTLVAITGWGQDSDRQKATLAGFNHHVVKPADSSVLLRLLRDVPRIPEIN